METQPTPTLGQKIRSARMERKLSQTQLADQVNSTQGMISRIELDKVQPAALVEKLKVFLNIDQLAPEQAV